jgi:hypothetical protein
MIAPLALSVVALCASLQPHPTRGKTDDAQQYANSAQNPSAIPAITPSSNNQTQPAENQQHTTPLRDKFLERLIDPVTWFTFALAVFAWRTWLVYERQADVMTHSLAHTQEIERAYLTMSHAPPGLFGDALLEERLDNGLHDVSVSIKVQNNGNTPANVLTTFSMFFLTNGPLPAQPPYEGAADTRQISLVKGNSFHTFENRAIDATAIREIKRGALQLYVLAYADYTDKFGRRHRVGYARQYNPSADRRDSYENGRSIFGRKTWDNRNNLPFVAQPYYNYDCEIDEQGCPKHREEQP